MQARRTLWFGAVLTGLGAFWAWFLKLRAAVFEPLCQTGEGWSATVPECQGLRERIVAMWCVTGLGVVLLGWGLVQWLTHRNRSMDTAPPD